MTVCSSPFIAGLYNAIMSLHITRICVTYMIAICVHSLIDDVLTFKVQINAYCSNVSIRQYYIRKCLEFTIT